jgi:hypothetical protein
MAHLKPLKKLALLAVSTCYLLSLSTAVIAETELLGEKVANSIETLKKAYQYSFDNAAIGILIAYGDGNGEGVTPQIIGDQFVNELKKRGYRSRYFYYKESKMRGMIVEYYIGHSAFGPWNVDKAAQNIGEATARMDAALNVHGDWWPNSDQKQE